MAQAIFTTGMFFSINITLFKIPINAFVTMFNLILHSQSWRYKEGMSGSYAQLVKSFEIQI